jgi:hypothetical protein
MTDYRRRPTTVVSAVQWHKVGDHPDVEGPTGTWSEGKTCEICGASMQAHGWLNGCGEYETETDLVCPGNWIVEKW